MVQFEDREKAAENDFSRDKELEFKASARRNRLLGMWAAELTGFSGAAVDAYARQVIESDFEETGDDDVYRKIKSDLDEKGIKQSEHQIRRHMDELMVIALKQIRSEV